MTPNLPSLLARLAAAVPGVCQERYSGTWAIGDYTFGVHPETGEVAATCDQINNWVYGQPALAWLQCAVQAGIEAQPGKLKLQLFGDLGWAADLGWANSFDDLSGPTVFYESAAEALLAAFVAWAEGPGVKG